MSALTANPLRTVYDALEHQGCAPRGPAHKFAARCPAHDDRSPSLAVREGADGRALVWCHAGCPTEQVVGALDLAWADLFPAGHHDAQPIPMLAKSKAPIDLVLRVLRELGIDYRCTRNPSMWVAAACPACELDVARWPLWLWTDERGRVGFSCFNGCPQVAVLTALVGPT